MPANEFYEWMIYEQMEPFGDRRGDLQAAMVQATLVNWSGKTRRENAAPLKPSDFMPNWEPKPVIQQTPDDHLKIFTLLATMHNAKVAN